MISASDDLGLGSAAKLLNDCISAAIDAIQERPKTVRILIKF